MKLKPKKHVLDISKISERNGFITQNEIKGETGENVDINIRLKYYYWLEFKKTRIYVSNI